MKKLEIKALDLTYYRETLENGLEVVLIPMEDKKNYFISYATRYGSEITTFKPKDSEDFIKVPEGVAHFLEHKMFEQEDGTDPFTFFSQSGTGANASTSYDSTQYICYGTKKFAENLRFLLQYVNAPYFTDENVEKEKGIIAQELNMYNDMPDYKLEMKLRENLFHTSPRREDIGGTVESVYQTTKEDLYNCYNNFYSPNNMFIVIAGNFNHKEALNIIFEELELKENVDYPEIKKVKEKTEVRVKTDSFKESIQIPKIALGLKIPEEVIGLDKYDTSLYLSMLTRILFGVTSDFYEKVTENHLMTGAYKDWEMQEGFRTFYFIAESEHPKELLKEIKSVLKDLQLDKETFERTKKVWIANEVKDTDYVENIIDSFYADMLRNKEIIPDKLDKVRNMDYDKLIKITKKIDFNNISTIIMTPNGK